MTDVLGLVADAQGLTTHTKPGRQAGRFGTEQADRLAESDDELDRKHEQVHRTIYR